MSSVDVQQPRASSTPQRVARGNVKWQREKAKSLSWMHKMKREMEAAKRESEELSCCPQPCAVQTHRSCMYWACAKRCYSVVATLQVDAAAGSQPRAALSASVQHDEGAVWAHLEPAPRDVMENRNPYPRTIHVTSDGPVAQRRPLPLRLPAGDLELLWEGQRKRRPPYGVGGAVKRAAGSAVQRCADVPVPGDFYNHLTERESDIGGFNEAAREAVTPVKGSLGMHHVQACTYKSNYFKEKERQLNMLNR